MRNSRRLKGPVHTASVPTPGDPRLTFFIDALRLLEAFVESEPFLLRISAAKRLRDRAERDARQAGEERVTALHVARAQRSFTEGLAA